MRKKLAIGFLVIVGIIVVVFLGISTRAYPVATANDSFITARLFALATHSAETYYGRLLSSGGVTEEEAVIFPLEMRRMALDSLIEDALIEEKLKTYYEASPLEEAINERVELALSSSTADISLAAEELFGVSLPDFRRIILAPQARWELLINELVRDGVDPDAWLENERMSARVTITLRDLMWQNGRVELTGEQPYTAKVKEFIEQIASTTEAIREASSTAQ